jgi:paraquat-inducible protein B
MHRLPITVGAELYPERLGHIFNDNGKPEDEEARVGALLGGLVSRGLRAQPRSGNLLTGQLYIAIDFVRGAPKTVFDVNAQPLQIPTAAGTLDDVQEQISSIVTKIDKIPFDSIGKRLDQGLSGMDTAFTHLNTDILPEAGRTLADVRKSMNDAAGSLSADSPLRQGIDQTLEELQRAARSLRAFTDYLSRHPESLIRGRQADPAPSTSGAGHE